MRRKQAKRAVLQTLYRIEEDAYQAATRIEHTLKIPNGIFDADEAQLLSPFFQVMVLQMFNGLWLVRHVCVCSSLALWAMG